MDIYDPIAEALGIAPNPDLHNECIEQYKTSECYRWYGPAKGNFREGYTTPEETKQKIREAMLKREQDPEWLARKEEIRAKMSAAKKGKPSNFKGRKMSPESRERIRQAQLKRGPQSLETRKKKSLAAKRQWELKRANEPGPYSESEET